MLKVSREDYRGFVSVDVPQVFKYVSHVGMCPATTGTHSHRLISSRSDDKMAAVVWRRVHDSSSRWGSLHRLCQCRSPSSAAYPFPQDRRLTCSSLPPSFPPFSSCSDKTCATLSDILRMIPDRTIRERQMAGMLRHLRATPGRDYFEMKITPGLSWISNARCAHRENRER